MKLTVFQSDKGDCLLLTGADGGNMLIDGGMRSSYTKFVRPILGKMRENNEELDLIYVSHIDQDHIAGVLQLVNDEMAWRVYEIHQNSPHGNPNVKKPRFKRPPVVKDIWHNSFYDLISKNRGRFEDQLAASAGFLFSMPGSEFDELAEHYVDLVTSKKEALQLSRRIGDKQLDIPLNRHFGDKLAYVRDGQGTINLGGMKIFVIGPFEDDLRNLRKEWNNWLRKNRSTIRELRRQAREDESQLTLSALQALADLGASSTGRLGDRGKVTSANLASLMLLVEEDGKTVLLSGDGHANDIIKGLKHYNKLNAQGGLHVDVLKVLHHGSEHNTDSNFTRLVTADHYVFCGNGAHANPDLRVIDAYARSRIGADKERSKNPEVDRPFRFWFNSKSTMPGGNKKYRKHMKKVERRVRYHRARSGGKLRYTFFSSAYRVIDI